MKRPVRILLTVVAVIAVIVCIFCILFIVQYVRGKSVSDKLGSGVRSGQVVEPLDPQDDGKYMAINVDFDSLHDVNPEIYAWIEVPGTNINYAVVQSAADDLFYDDHGVDRSYYSGGSIFSAARTILAQGIRPFVVKLTVCAKACTPVSVLPLPTVVIFSPHSLLNTSSSTFCTAVTFFCF